MIAQLGARLAALPTPYTLLYQQVDACWAMRNIGASASISDKGNPYLYTAAPTAKNPDAYKEDTCAINTTVTRLPDIALSDVYYSSCPKDGTFPPEMAPRDARTSPSAERPCYTHHLTGVTTCTADFLGPIQAMVFVVAQSNFSSQYLLLEEAQNILACGTGGKMYPFVEAPQLNLYDRENGFTNGVPLLTYSCLALPTSYYITSTSRATLVKPSEGQPEWAVVTKMRQSINPAASFGLISVENADECRDFMRALAVVGPGQGGGNKAFLPDSDASSRDRRNVRDGHYVIQGPLHMVARVGEGDNVPTSPMAQRFLNWMQSKPGAPGEEPLPFNMIDVFAKSGVVPQCAMRVIRASECGPFKLYRDPAPCGCYFESKATGIAVPPNCTACNATSECGAGRTCSFGFCE